MIGMLIYIINQILGMRLQHIIVSITIVLRGTYIQDTRTFGNYNTYTFQEYPVTSDICYRNDFDSICIIVFICCIFFVFLCNIVTSLIRRGGALGGLL